jgi:hypothetical protein
MACLRNISVDTLHKGDTEDDDDDNNNNYNLRKYLEAVPGEHLIDSLQKTAVLGTSHIIRKVLQCEA